MQPGAKLGGLHPVDAGGTGVLLDASERRRQVAPGENFLPEVACLGGGVRFRLVRRREAAALFAGSFGLHPMRPLREGPWRGWLRSSLPARAPRSLARLRVRPFAAHDPAATTASADSCRVTGRLSAAGVGRLASRPTSRQVSPDKGSNLPRAPAASTLRSLDDRDFDVFRRLVRTAPPSMRFVFLGSRFRLRLPSHPASRRRSWPWLVVSVI
jgi:hypothetical protein